MIGNDIVDLCCAKKESNWRRKGYLDKIYTPSEQDLINSSSNPEQMVWILWSMKEATYKANNRITKIKEFAPTKIICVIDITEDSIFYGRTFYNSLEYNNKTYIYKDYIHTIAYYNSTLFSEIKVIFIGKYTKDYMDFLKSNNYLLFSENIVKDEFGIPNLYNEITEEYKPISISHHGKFLGLVTI